MEISSQERSHLPHLLQDYVRSLVQSIRPVIHLRRDRLWEVDLLRGVAILMMVVYHLVWDLYGLAGWNIPMYGPFWSTWQRITAGLFIGLVGVSLHLRRQRKRGQPAAYGARLRGLVIFTWGMVITLVTFLFRPQEFVRFGILHFIGVSILLAYSMASFRWLNLLLGSLLLYLPRLTAWRHQLGVLEWAGLDRAPHPAFDYFPLVPWLGLVLLGIFFAHLLFPEGKRRLPLQPTSPGPLRWLQLAGQNSLLIYLIHQPLLVAGLTLIGIL